MAEVFYPQGDGSRDKKPAKKSRTKVDAEQEKSAAMDGAWNQNVGTLVAREQLKSVIERIERLEEEKKAIADDIRDVFAEAKANGFDVKVLREVLKLRKMDLAERQVLDATRDLYLQALGMLPEFEPAQAETARASS